MNFEEYLQEDLEDGEGMYQDASSGVVDVLRALYGVMGDYPSAFDLVEQELLDTDKSYTYEEALDIARKVLKDAYTDADILGETAEELLVAAKAKEILDEADARDKFGSACAELGIPDKEQLVRTGGFMLQEGQTWEQFFMSLFNVWLKDVIPNEEERRKRLEEIVKS